ncbi:hypothetical protein B0H17DRAFT_1245104, partial [Mycena rosella]
ELLCTLQMKVIISFVGSSDLVKFSEQLYAFTENGLTTDKMSQVFKSQSYNQICWRGPVQVARQFYPALPHGHGFRDPNGWNLCGILQQHDQCQPYWVQCI